MSQSARMSQCKKHRTFRKQCQRITVRKEILSSQWKNDGNSAEIFAVRQNGHGHCYGRNGEFYITTGPV